MKRWIHFSICLLSGVTLLAVSSCIPIHLRAVDSSILERAGQKTPSLVERGLVLLREKKIGAAELLFQAAKQEEISGHEKLRAAIEHSSLTHPEWQVLGAESHSETLLGLVQKNSSDKRQTRRTKENAVKTLDASALQNAKPFTELIIQSENRKKALESLSRSPSPVIQQLMRCRALTNTVLFSPSKSSSGQAFDAAVSTCGILIEEQILPRGLTDAILKTTSSALSSGNSQPIEQILLDFMSLGQRFNWGQLVTFCERIEDAETLRLQANLARRTDNQLPILFSAVDLSGKSAAVAKYLMNFGLDGQKDLAASLQYRAGSVSELLQRNQRLHQSGAQKRLNGLPGTFVHLSWRMPKLALGLKWFLYLSAGFLFALALHFARPQTPIAERPFHVRSFHIAREILFALGFLLVVLILSEPFLAQENQNWDFPIRLHLPTVGSAVSAQSTGAHGSIMNQLSLLTLLLFFILQALLYVACLIKLAEIRRQTFPPNVKLKLLENEEHLFDAGLYLGFAGTIISLILVSMGVIKPSLMAAYSSTSFGVIFVSVFKIFHLRPLRRKLLIETEAAKNVSAPPAEHTLSSPL